MGTISGYCIRPYSSFQIGFDKDCHSWNPLPPSWWADFCFYSANFHPFHAIFSCDPSNRLSGVERFSVELVVITFALWCAYREADWVCKQEAPIRILSNEGFFRFTMLTVLSMIVHFTMVRLFTCPCGAVNNATATVAQQKKARFLSGLGELLAYFCVVVALLYLVCTLLLAAFHGHRDPFWDKPPSVTARP